MICPPGPQPLLLAAMVLPSSVKAPERMKTLPPLSGPAGVLAVRTEAVEPPLISTGPKLVTVKAEELRGSTGTSPVPATLVTWIAPAGAERLAPVGANGGGAG